MRIFFITLMAAAAALAQTAAAPAFDVASVKASLGGGREGFRRENIEATPGSLTMRNITLKSCIAWAYHVTEIQVSGPDWMGNERYDLAAKAAGPANEAQLRVMLQGLLADRFHVQLHRQTKEMSAYVLTVGKNGPKFQESKTDGEMAIDPDRKTLTVTAHRVPVSQLVDMLVKIYQMPVIDQTGLAGRYDVTINAAKYIPQSGERPSDPLAIIEAGLQEELGLKLEARKMAVDLLIVDHAEKAPVEN